MIEQKTFRVNSIKAKKKGISMPCTVIVWATIDGDKSIMHVNIKAKKIAYVGGVLQDVYIEIQSGKYNSNAQDVYNKYCYFNIKDARSILSREVKKLLIAFESKTRLLNQI